MTHGSDTNGCGSYAGLEAAGAFAVPCDFEALIPSAQQVIVPGGGQKAAGKGSRGREEDAVNAVEQVKWGWQRSFGSKCNGLQWVRQWLRRGGERRFKAKPAVLSPLVGLGGGRDSVAAMQPKAATKSTWR